MDRKKVLAAKVPYIELFGVDGMGKGRPSKDSLAAALLPQLETPPISVVGSAEVAYRIRGEARVRAMTVMKAVFAKEFKAIYKKEMDHLVEVEVGTMVGRSGGTGARGGQSGASFGMAQASS